MQSLDTDLRSQLESTVEEAREVAETGANAALNQLGVGDREKPDYLDDEQAELRRRLRARGRQLGDELKSRQRSGEQETIRLAREIAYEHWHRMLFARFLAENDLLVHPELDVAVTLEDCEALAEEEGGVQDGFELAARFATGMLPQIFREDDPVLDLDMAPEHRNKLKRMVQDLPEAVFQADDSLGWVYQFWQSKRKDEVNDSGDKIGADELPAVTQLFTEHYMVQFLLDNTLGAWWTARHPDADIDLDFEYLRYVEDEDTGEEVPASGRFDGWPDTAAELTVMDPCMGSGHFLVAALPMLARMRMHEEGLSAEEAVDRVIAENLHGLEIDERCTQIAAFALAMAAWTFDGTSGYRELPEMNLACSGLAPEGDLEDWETLAGDDERLQNGMRRLYTLFQDAPTLGSLIDPSAPENRLDTATFEELEPLLEEALSNGKDVEQTERGVVAYGIARAAEMLSDNYWLLITNVPYLGRNKQSDSLRSYCDEQYPQASSGLSAVFLKRGLEKSENKGSTAFVTQHNWIFQTSYTKFREGLLTKSKIRIVSKLGENAFRSPQAAGAFAALSIVSQHRPSKRSSVCGLDVSGFDGVDEKIDGLRDGTVEFRPQQNILKSQGSIISVEEVESLSPLSKYAYCFQGTSTGDNDKYTRSFWEIQSEDRWQGFQNPSHNTTLFGGRSTVVAWKWLLREGEGKAIRGEDAWKRQGVALGQMRDLPATVYTGNKFSNSTPVIIPYDEKWLPALWEFASSDGLYEAIRALNPKLSVDNGYINKVSWDPSHWQEVAEDKYPNGLPDPYSNDPTQWIFHGHPKPSERSLQVATARLLGYRWPAERATESSSAQAQEMDLSDEAREWIERCEELSQHVDDDGIICIPAVQGERPAADRIRELLADAYGNDWSEGVLQDLLDEWGYRSGGLEGWLDGATARQKGKFAQQHNKLFGHRPFIWHVSDEHADGFSALVN